MLGGVLYGTILYRKPLTFRRALWADLVVALICNIFLNTLWLSMMSGKAMMVLLPMRVLKNLIKWPVDAALFYLIAKRMESLGLVRMIRKFQASDAGGFVLSKRKHTWTAKVCGHGGCMP